MVTYMSSGGLLIPTLCFYISDHVSCEALLQMYGTLDDPNGTTAQNQQKTAPKAIILHAVGLQDYSLIRSQGTIMILIVI